MEYAVEFIFARPHNETYFEYAINDIDRLKWINRDDLKHFISNNISRDIIKIHEIKDLVDGYCSFIIDNTNEEFYELDFDFNPKDITNIRDSKEKPKNSFQKVIDKFKGNKII